MLRAPLLNGQQVRFDGGQMLAAFGQIVLYQLVVQVRFAHRGPQFPVTLKCWCMRIDRNSSSSSAEALITANWPPILRMEL
jgi:hypothetical protein